MDKDVGSSKLSPIALGMVSVRVAASGQSGILNIVAGGGSPASGIGDGGPATRAGWSFLSAWPSTAVIST